MILLLSEAPSPPPPLSLPTVLFLFPQPIPSGATRQLTTFRVLFPPNQKGSLFLFVLKDRWSNSEPTWNIDAEALAFPLLFLFAKRFFSPFPPTHREKIRHVPHPVGRAAQGVCRLFLGRRVPNWNGSSYPSISLFFSLPRLRANSPNPLFPP